METNHNRKQPGCLDAARFGQWCRCAHTRQYLQTIRERTWAQGNAENSVLDSIVYRGRNSEILMGRREMRPKGLNRVGQHDYRPRLDFSMHTASLHMLCRCTSAGMEQSECHPIDWSVVLRHISHASAVCIHPDVWTTCWDLLDRSYQTLQSGDML